jgi:hypothetical protein
MAEVGKNKDIKGSVFKFLEKDFSISQLRQLGIDDSDARYLRAKILERNEKSMTTMEKNIPMVLVPHHQVRFFRVDRVRDKMTGILIRPEVFAVTPNNGSRDILGIKFQYDFERGFTNFTITFNNARGKNKNRFSSGDLVEFYFRLVGDDELRSLETPGSMYQKNKEKVEGMPLCFTGVLEKYTAKQSPDGLTIEWSGRTGGYITSERNISRNFPVDGKQQDDKAGQMSYEEILWQIIVNRTGLVMGEIDLGITEGKDTQGKEQEIKGTLDLMAADVNKSDEPTFKKDFLAGVEKILLKEPYCCFEEASREENDTSEKKETKKYVRWSCLLEYDLLTPRFFTQADVDARSDDKQKFGDYQIPFMGTGDLERDTISSKESPAPVDTRIRFKTKWAMELYAFQRERVMKNKSEIERVNPIKVQVGSEQAAYRSVMILPEWVKGRSRSDTIDEIFRFVYGRPIKEDERDAFTKQFEDKNKKESGFLGWLTGLFSSKKEEEEGTAAFDLAANPIHWGTKWKPGNDFIVGENVTVSVPPAGSKDGPKKYYVENGVLAPDGEKKLFDVFTAYTFSKKEDNPGYSFTFITYEGGGELIDIQLTAGTVTTTVHGVPNRIDAIAQVLENELPVEVEIAEDGKKDLGQPVLVNGKAYELNVEASQQSSWLKSELTKKDWPTNGKVIDEIQKILKKFFACVFYVDEYGIGHIRPRYKNSQKQEYGSQEAGTPPIWGLYAGQPIYPRLFETEMSDTLKSCPTSIIVHGQTNSQGSGVFSKVDHALLMSLFGEIQRYETENMPIHSRLEAKIIAKNKILDYARNALTFACQCDLIPELRPGHRIDIVDLAVGVTGRFLAESIQWEYSKDTGTKMSVGLSFCELASDDAFTSAAIVTSKKIEGDYDKRLAESINDRQSMLGFSLIRTSELETGKDKDSLEKINAEFADKVLPVFNLGKDGGVIRLIPRDGFETLDKEPVSGDEDK